MDWHEAVAKARVVDVALQLYGCNQARALWAQLGLPATLGDAAIASSALNSASGPRNGIR